jgi:hypothetical protein
MVTEPNLVNYCREIHNIDVITGRVADRYLYVWFELNDDLKFKQFINKPALAKL